MPDPGVSLYDTTPYDTPLTKTSPREDVGPNEGRASGQDDRQSMYQEGDASQLITAFYLEANTLAANKL